MWWVDLHVHIYLLKKLGFIILMQKLLELMRSELALDEIHVMRGSLNLKKWTIYETCLNYKWFFTAFVLLALAVYIYMVPSCLRGCGKFPKFHRMTFKSAFSECNMKPKMHSSQFRRGGCVSLYYWVVWHTVC